MNRPGSKRLSYPGSKCVIQYLEVYKRLSLATRCPSLRPIHQLTPLTIDNLRLGSSYYTLNGFLHQFGAFNAETSQLELNIAEAQNVDYVGLDMLDQYWGEDLDLEPSDLKLGIFPRERRRQFRGLQGQMFEAIQEQIPNFGQFLDLIERPEFQFLVPMRNQLLFQRRPDIPDIDINIPNYQDEQMQLFRRLHRQGYEMANQVQFQHSRTLPGANARDAARSHLAKILSRETLIKNLEIELDGGVLTIPADYRFRVRTLSLYSDKFLDPLASIMEVSTYKTLKIRKITEQSARHPLLRSFERLELGPVRHPDWGSYIENLPNTETYVGVFLPTPEQFGNVARRWVRENRQIGTKLSINTNQRQWGPRDVQELLGRIRQELRGRWKRGSNRRGNEVPRWVVYPFDDRREIKIYGQPEPDLKVIVMEVVELASAR